jgi:hypothetical protein
MCPSSVVNNSPEVAFHTRTVPFADPDTMRDPFGENDTEFTSLGSVIGLPIGFPVWLSHTRTVPFAEPDTMRDPSGENDTELTAPVDPFKIALLVKNGVSGEIHDPLPSKLYLGSSGCGNPYVNTSSLLHSS